MSMLVIALALFAWQLMPQRAYVLDHPIDPQLLIIATQDGRYPFTLLSGADCSWVHSDMNIDIASENDQLWKVQDESGDTCNIVIQNAGNPVDPTPCFFDDQGVCNIDGEHQWT
jgi:hypothetical protein